ncbi:MAG TPA: hypothetical protein ACHBX0_07465, partial [Arsenophonus sp.]
DLYSLGCSSTIPYCSFPKFRGITIRRHLGLLLTDYLVSKVPEVVQLVTVGVKADGTIGGVARETVITKQGCTISADTLRLHSRACSREEATAKVCAGLNQHNKYQRVAALSLAGQLHFRAGLTISLKNFGRLSGVWLITEVKHTLRVRVRLPECDNLWTAWLPLLQHNT